MIAGSKTLAKALRAAALALEEGKDDEVHSHLKEFPEAVRSYARNFGLSDREADDVVEAVRALQPRPGIKVRQDGRPRTTMSTVPTLHNKRRKGRAPSEG